MRKHLAVLIAAAALVACGQTGPRIVGSEGVEARDAALLDHAGEPLALASSWAEHYAIVVFYRGHW